MTKEQLIEKTKWQIQVIQATNNHTNDLNYYKSILSALEQQPCDDAISRILQRMWNCRGKHTTSIDKVKMEQIIREELPSVTPTCEEREKEACPYYAG